MSAVLSAFAFVAFVASVAALAVLVNRWRRPLDAPTESEPAGLPSSEVRCTGLHTHDYLKTMRPAPICQGCMRWQSAHTPGPRQSPPAEIVTDSLGTVWCPMRIGG